MIRESSALLTLYGIALLLSVLPAYQIDGIPLLWASKILVITITLAWFLQDRLFSTRVIPRNFLFVIAIMMIEIFGAMFSSCSVKAISGMTTNYLVFLILPWLNLVMFVFSILLIVRIFYLGRQETLFKLIVILGVVVSLYSWYAFIAYHLGLPFLKSNMIGTSGGNVAYSFHVYRLIGTFREPSHLAYFLVLPFFYSILTNMRKSKYVILVTIMLTGSLTALIPLIFFFILNAFFSKNRALLVRVVFFMVLIILGWLFMRSLTGGVFATISSVYGRIDKILMYGYSASNRGYIIYFLNKTFSARPWFDIFFGCGYGNASLYLSNYFHNNFVMSYQSLYFKYLYAFGIAGLLAMILYFMRPVFLFFSMKNREDTPGLKHLFYLYGSYLIMLAVMQDNFDIFFSIAMGSLVGACIINAQGEK